MLKRTVIVLSLVLSLVTATAAQVPATTLDKKAAKVRAKVEDLGIGHRVTVKLKIKGDDYHGAVSKIDITSFEIVDVDLKQALKFEYTDVKSVRGNYGGKNIFGQRTNPKTGTIVGIGMLGGLIALLAITIGSMR